MVALQSTWHQYVHGVTLSHRNISHSVSSVDLIDYVLETQPKIHILKNSDAACTVLSTHGVYSKQDMPNYNFTGLYYSAFKR